MSKLLIMTAAAAGLMFCGTAAQAQVGCAPYAPAYTYSYVPAYQTAVVPAPAVVVPAYGYAPYHRHHHHYYRPGFTVRTPGFGFYYR